MRPPVQSPWNAGIVWSTYGTPMELLWNSYGTTCQQHENNTGAAGWQQAWGASMGAFGCRRFFLCRRGESCNSVCSSAPEFKNGTDGSLQIALDTTHSARTPHSFIGIDQDGLTSIIEQRAAGTRSVIGAMLESNLHEGTGKLARPPASLVRLAGHARLRPGCFPQPRCRTECVSLTQNA